MRILIIDDEESIRKTTTFLLEGLGHETVAVANRSAALRQLDKARYDVAFLDMNLVGESGLDLLPILLKSNPHLDVIVFTAFASIENAVEAMRLGAVDYLPKPFTPEQVRQVLAKVNKTRQLEDRVAELESRLSHDSPNTDLETDEEAMHQVYEIAFKAAATPATIMILGESGTGKTVLARAVHERSPQRNKPFVTVSCPSLSRELLESELFGHVKGSFTGATSDTWGKVAQADGGTLFLDEIGELPVEIQPKLLRLLQEREYERLGEPKTRTANVRVIAATNRNLENLVSEGRFREDLFYRLNVIALNMPPLRERRRDLKHLAAGYLDFFSAQCGKKIEGFSPEAEKSMEKYTWPGNLRELRNVVERAVILTNGYKILPVDLPAKIISGAPAVESSQMRPGMNISLDELEQEHIRRVMASSLTMEEAARILQIDPATLYRKRKKMSQ